jgi:hypothetical protein
MSELLAVKGMNDILPPTIGALGMGSKTPCARDAPLRLPQPIRTPSSSPRRCSCAASAR